ncbi:hypothetical protein O181_117300 [Austropuccinia psidii MF-1]|uniref:Uncharacterized protein n=1 Tax=Austropuccinia psidii MF-1 TaxID=1389203 RepID=A0A9Q3KE46_9BASI|nr:hypothetical protein [Austropuccinia psidii MF-1]
MDATPKYREQFYRRGKPESKKIGQPSNPGHRIKVERAKSYSGSYSCGKRNPTITSHTPIRTPQNSGRFFQNSSFFTDPGGLQNKARGGREEQNPFNQRKQEKYSLMAVAKEVSKIKK